MEVSDLKHSLEEVVIHTAREPLALLDEALRIRSANQAFCEFLELSLSQVTGESVFEVSQSRFDLPQIRAAFEALQHGASEVQNVRIEGAEVRGVAHTLVMNASRLPAPEQGGSILFAFEDITERQRAAEVRYRRLFETARDGILMADAETGEILDLNPFAERLLGYSCDELTGRNFQEVDPMRSAPELLAAMETVRKLGIFRGDDIELRTRGGNEIHVELVATLYTEGDRRAIQFNLRDVSERKKFEREYQETQKLESVGLLAGGIAHDFNNLLTGILGNASLALSQAAPEDGVRKRLRAIVDAAERAAFLTRQMLAYAGKGRFMSSKIDLGHFVDELADLLRTSVPKNVELMVVREPDLPQVEADPVQVQQVVMNLVINGAEAIGETRAGTVTVRTSARKIEAEQAAELFQGDRSAAGLYVEMEVSDTGAGMDEAVMDRIFDPFFTTKFTGRGLGLAAVQGIIRAHRGAIRVSSVPGCGSTFTVLLPGANAGPATRMAAEARGPARIPAGSVALVIDDEASIRALAANVLNGAGMEVLLAENGKAGVEVFRERQARISVVLLDIQMPVMGGEEALAQLQEVDPNVPVILSSGFDVSEAERRFAARKLTHFLQKPYTAARLIEAVAESLKGQRGET